MLLFLVTPCLAVTVQPCIEWIPIKKMCFIRATCREKGSQYAKSWAARTIWKELKPSVQHFAANEVSFISKNYVREWSYTCFRVIEYYNISEKLPPSVMISIDLPILVFSIFRAFNYYSIMGSMNYFGQVVFEILQKLTSWKAILETQK